MNATPVTLRPITLSPLAGAASPSVDSPAEREPLGRTGLLLILAFWTVIAVLTSANSLLEPRRGPFAPTMPLSGVLLACLNAYMWAALTVPIFWLTSRFTLERSRLSHWLLYVGLGLAMAIAVDFINSIVRHKLYYATEPLTQQFLAVALARRFWFMNEFIVYVAVVAAGFAHNYFLRYRARREESVRLQAEALVLQAQLADARLAALRTQLNPHFLFNTLHAVSALVERDPRGVRRMIARLSELLRTSLDEADEPEVPLQRELVFTERYLDVIQIRFQGHLHVDMAIDSDVRDALVPNLILQPLVENAIKHGISKLAGEGHIEVCARRDGPRVVISVRDNGPDTGSAAVCSLDDDGARLPAPTGGVGLRNTRARLAALYGIEQSLTLKPADGGGLVAEVSLPYHTNSDLRAKAVTASTAADAAAAD